MIEYLKSLFNDRRYGPSERGASAVEYGLLVAGIAALIVGAVFALGPIVKESFNKTCDTIGANDNNTATAADCAS